MRNQKGVTAMAIILLGLLALSVVLLDGTSITLKQREAKKLQSGRSFAVSYCSKSHEKLPPECKISKVYQCGQGYILRTGCIGTGDVILDQSGHFSNWCGYTTLGAPADNCGSYWLDPQGKDCTQTKNLCL